MKRRDDFEEAQRRLFSLVTSPEQSSRASARKEAALLLKRGERLVPHERVEIYRRMYWGRTLDSLLDDYPGVAALLGSDAFHAIAENYVKTVGSHSYSLRDLGSQFPLFLRRQLGSERPDIVDVARYEWAQIEAFDAASRPPVQVAEVGPRRKIRLQPYVRMITVAYPVGEYVSSIKSDGVLRKDASQAWVKSGASRSARAKGLPREVRYMLAVHRWEGRLYFKRLEPGEAKVLSALAKGATLSRAAAALPKLTSRDPDKAAADLTRWFTTWTSLGWLV